MQQELHAFSSNGNTRQLTTQIFVWDVLYFLIQKQKIKQRETALVPLASPEAQLEHSGSPRKWHGSLTGSFSLVTQNR